VEITPRTLCLVLAVICFAAATLWVPPNPPRFSLLPAGLTFLALAFLLP
jgi:hypothetical protein